MEERFRKQEPYLGALAESSLGRGRALLEEGDATPAIESFVAAGTLWPDAKVPQLLLAKAYYQKGDRENAERVLQALYQRAGTHQDEVVLWVAAIYKYFQEFERGLEWSQYAGQEALRLRLQVDFSNLLGRFEEAVRIGREAIRKFPDDGRTHHFLAVALIRDPKLAAEGLEVAKRAWDLSPGCADTLSLLATAYQCTGDSGKAEELFQRAIDLSPREPRGYDHLARLLMKEGRLREAEERFRQAIAVMEKSSRFHFLKPHNSLGNVLMAQGKLEECIGAYRNAIEFEPRAPIPRGNLGIIFRRLGRFEEGEECLRNAVELAPGDPRLARQLALVHLQKDRPEQAITVLEQALRAAPRYRPAASDLAFILEREGRPLEAFDRLFQMLKDSGQDRTLHESLVALEHRRGRGEVFAEKWDEVAEWLEGTPQFREGKPGILNTLAVALLHGREKRDPGRARELARAAVEKTDRKLPRFLATLAEAELALGRTGAAVPLLEEALRLPHPLRAHREMLQECRTLLGQGRGGTLEREGRIEEAQGSVHEAVQADRESPESRLRLAESLREAGKPEEAERELRSALETVSTGNQRDLWTLWASVCLSDLGRDPSELLAGFPPARAKEAQADGGGNAEGEVPGGGAPGDPASDLRWLFERLRGREPIRIDCGGKGWRNAQDAVWGPDRFFEGGWERARETYDIAGTDDDPVYQTARWFPEEEIAGGYRIPLPRGSYRVTLHFTETALWDRFPRIMDVAIENSQALEAYDPLSRGFATADRRQFEVEVDDGLLEIQFLPRREDAMIAGIEIEKI
jgi:tetratricopeptide (TPR) repeat protein